MSLRHRDGSDPRPAHGNNLIAYLVEAEEVGIEWTRDDMKKLCRLLDTIIGTNGYAEYVDGSGSGSGWFNDGFCKRGRYDANLQRRLEAHTVGRGTQLYGNGALNAFHLLTPPGNTPRSAPRRIPLVIP